MNKIDTLNKLLAEADEAYMNSVFKILDQMVPYLDSEFRGKVAQDICWEKHGEEPDEIILMHDGRAFDNYALFDILTERIQRTRENNKDVQPDIDARYWCETCGSHSHECHPDSGLCFHCNTDNWEPENWRKIV